MKIKYITTLFFLLSTFNNIECSIGCMDNSYHAYLCNDGKLCKYRRHDHKTLHYVKCACPCNEYIVLARKGKCPGCMHYHKPSVDLTIDKTNVHNYSPESFNIGLGSTITGVITDINENGIIIQTHNGRVGLVPLNQISWIYNYKTLDDLKANFQVGEEIEAIVVSSDGDTLILNIKY